MLRKSCWLPARRPPCMSEQLGGLATWAKAKFLPPMRMLRSGLRACSVNSDGQVLMACRIKLRSKRTRSEPGRTSAPAFFKISRASTCMKSMPISSRIVSDASWMASSSSSDTTGVAGKRCFKLRYLTVDGATRTVPLPRPARRLGAAVAGASSVMPGDSSN